MNRALLAAAAASALTGLPLQAVAAPSSANVKQAISDTMLANLKRRNLVIEGSNGPVAAINAIPGAVTHYDSLEVGGCANYPGITWVEVLCKMGILANGSSIGDDDEKKVDLYGGVGGGWGGAGAGVGSWEVDCSNLDWSFDPQGNWIIPSYPLSVGGPIDVAEGSVPGTAYWFYACGWFNATMCGGQENVMADSAEAALRRYMHLFNKHTQPTAKLWYGVIGPKTVNGLPCVRFATIATTVSYGSGLEPRYEDTKCVTAASHTQVSASQESNANDAPHKSCPIDKTSSGGGSFHFYGGSNLQFHLHQCVWYAPNPQIGDSGYAINPKTSLPLSEVLAMQTVTTPALKAFEHCPIDEKAIKKLTDGLWKKASEIPGYNGSPYAPIEDGDVRPGNTKAQDIVSEVDGPMPPANPDSPAPETPTPETPGGGTIDLGPDPGVGAPSLGDVPTGIMDPIFNWLPDLPSITLPPTTEAECPVFAVNLMSFFGTEDGILIMDNHCAIFEQNRAAIGGLMVVIFTIAAGLIVIRA